MSGSGRHEHTAIIRRRGLAWGWVTPHGQRFYGIDFGRFAVGVLLDA